MPNLPPDVKPATKVWLMLVFRRMPGYRPAKSGRSWYRVLPSREAALKAGAQLRARGVSFKCVTRLDYKPPPSGKVKHHGRFSPLRERAGPPESASLRASRESDFEEYKRSMARPLPAPSVLPEPIGAAPVGFVMPGLSKGAPDPYRHRR